MGDAAEGLIDADLRIQERMEELEQERKAARKAAPTKDPVKVRELESCRLARIELQRQFEATDTPRPPRAARRRPSPSSTGG